MMRCAVFFGLVNGAMILLFRTEIAHHHDVTLTVGLHAAEVGLVGSVLMILCALGSAS